MMRHLIKADLRYPGLWRNCVGALSPMLGPTGSSTLRDNSGSENHGTMTNMDPATDWVLDGGRYALDFDGTNDHVVFAKTGTSTIHTVSCWVNNRDTGDAILVGGGLNTYTMYTDSNAGGGNLYYSASTGNYKFVAHGGMASVWTHLSVTREDSVLNWYKNGAWLGTQTLTTNTPAAILYLGREDLGFYANMMMDDVMIHNRCIMPSEIALLARRRGIAYETSHRRSYKAAAVAPPGTNQSASIFLPM